MLAFSLYISPLPVWCICLYDFLPENNRAENIADFDNQETFAQFLWSTRMICINLGS